MTGMPISYPSPIAAGAATTMVYDAITAMLSMTDANGHTCVENIYSEAGAS
jgi:hypothetical protein